MHDGTTPLILAARLAIEGMVEDLIHADADINIPDNSGKTALHWAASVNNVDAVNILLANNANKDAQDDKVKIYYGIQLANKLYILLTQSTNLEYFSLR